MNLDKLIDKVFTAEKFQSELKKLEVKYAIESIKELDKTFASVKEIPIDIKASYLLNVASLLTNSSQANHQKASLKISHYFVQFGSQIEQKASYLILDMLLNQPAKKLAKKNTLINSEIERSFPIGFFLDSMQRENLQTIRVDSKDDFYSNRFQKEFWDILESDKQIISVSAPTSVGKSYLAKKWIKHILQLDNDLVVNVGIIVPSRALINEFELDFQKELKEDLDKVYVSSMPIESKMQEKMKKRIYIFTQERMNIFLSNESSPIKFSALFVDEAYKIADKARGILLEAVVDRLFKENENLKLVFASPNIKNPENIFNQCHPIKNRIPLVNQNRFYLIGKERKPHIWEAKLIRKLQEPINLGETQLGTSCLKGAPKKERLSKIAHHFGKDSEGNIIYSDAGDQTEEIAEALYDLLPVVDTEKEDEDINNLIDLCRETIHKEFRLSKYLTKGIGFHYGNMPQLVRLEIEKLFRLKKIKFLICTSTLLEGVNLGCKNIFLHNPKRGNSQEMESGDLLNLEGRAGRLGKEFQGNIFYIDWLHEDESDEELEIQRSTVKTLEQEFKNVLDLFNRNKNVNEVSEEVEALSGFLFHQLISNPDIRDIDIVKEICSEEQLNQLQLALDEYKEEITLPNQLLSRHPITYHYSMQQLYRKFENKYSNRPEDLIPLIKPNRKRGQKDYDDPTYISLLKILIRMKGIFQTSYNKFQTPKYHALISYKWISGHSLPRIIAASLQHNIEFNKEHKEEIKNKKISKKPDNIHTVIRNVFRAVEQIARYEVPKLLRCYVDVMNFFFIELGRDDLVDKESNISLYLEFGVSSKTHLSMILLKISRATISKLANLDDNEHQIELPNSLNEKEVLTWLTNNIEQIERERILTRIQLNEIKDILAHNH